MIKMVITMVKISASCIKGDQVYSNQSVNEVVYVDKRFRSGEYFDGILDPCYSCLQLNHSSFPSLSECHCVGGRERSSCVRIPLVCGGGVM